MARSSRYGIAAVLCGTTLAWGAGAAARGTFSTGGQTLKVVDAFAYEGKAEFGDETVIHLRLSGTAFDRAKLESVMDHGAEVRRQSGTPYAQLQFGKDGTYSGASYALGGRANCGFCGDSRVASKAAVKVVGGALKGTIRIAPADYADGKGPAIDLTLDVPVASVTGATALPANGGEAAKALEACRQTVKREDAAALKTVCLAPDDPRVAQAAQYHMDTQVQSMLSFYAAESDSLSLATLKVTGGRTKGDWAELTVEGSGDSGKKKGSVFLRKVGGTWRFDHDSLESVF